MSVFNFKQFSIIQDKSAMKVGTDGVLIGAWADIKHCNEEKENYYELCTMHYTLKMLDIGTGTGVIALMLAQRFPDAVIDAIEIDHDAAEEAALNVKNSPWADRINVIEASLADFSKTQNSKLKTQNSYDLIVINPPFYNATLKPEDDARAMARHEDSLPFKEVTAFADKYLSDNGQLAVIYPTNNEENIMLGVASSSLKISKICDIFTKAPSLSNQNLKPKRRMLLLGKNCEGGIVRETLCLRNENGEYSKEYRALTEDFYITLK